MPQYPNFVGLSKYKGSWSATNNIAVTSDATPLTIEGLYGEGRRNTWGPGSNISGSGGYSLSASCTSNLTGGLANLTAAAGDFWKVTDAANRTLGASTEWAEGDYIIYTSGSEWIRLYSADVQSSIIVGNMSSGSLSNTLLTASSGQGILFHYYDNATSSFSGSHQFTFNPAGPNVELTGNLIMTGNLFVEGVIKGNQFSVTTVVENVSNIHVSGATKFGNSTDDLHQYTGSLDITGAFDSGANQVPVITVKGDGVYGQQAYDIQLFQGPIKVVAENRDNYIHLVSDEASDATDAYILTKDAVGLAFGGNNTTPILTVDVGDEKVGIGTTAPQSHLHVTGTISGSAGYFTGDVGVSGAFSTAGSLSAGTFSATNTVSGTDGDFVGNVKVSGSLHGGFISGSSLDLSSGGINLSGTMTFASSSAFNLTGANISGHKAELGQLVLSGNVSEGIILGTTSSIHMESVQKIILDARNTGSFLSSLFHSDYRIIELQNRGGSVLKSYEHGTSGRFVDYNADKYDQMFQWYGTSTGSNADWRFDPGASGVPYWTFARNQVGGVSIGSADTPKTRLWVSGNLSASSGLYTGDISASGTITSHVVSASIGYLAGGLSASGSISSGINVSAVNTVTGTDGYYEGMMHVSGNAKFGSADTNVFITSQLTGNVGMSGTLGQFATLQVGGANIGSGSTPWQHNGGAIFYTNGNVGASTDDPQNPLHVSGTAFFSGSLLGGQDPLKIAGLRTASFAGPGSYLGLDSDGKVVLNTAGSGGGTITALNNQAANRLVTIGSTTTELDGEANASFDGATLNITGTLRANTIAGVTQVTAVTHLTASEMSSSVLTINQGGLTIDGTAVSSTAGELNILDGVTATASEINFNDVDAGVATANKSLVLNSGKEIGDITALSGTLFRAATLSGSNLQISQGSAFISGTLTVGGGLNLDTFSDDITFASVNNIFSYNLWKSNASGGTEIKNTNGKLTLSGSGGVFIDPTAGQSVIINEAGEAADLRVESDARTHMLFVDGSENGVFIGTSVDGLAPSGTFEVTNQMGESKPLVQLNNNALTQNALDINAINTSANVFDITADSLTSGKALEVSSNSSNTTTREVAYISNEHASSEASTLRVYNNAAGYPALVIQGAQTGYILTTASSNTAGQTIGADKMLHAAWSAAARNAGQTDTTDTAANIVAQIPNCAVGDSFEFIFLNVSSNGITLAGGTGVTNLAGGSASFAIAAGKGRKFRFRVSSISGGSEAVQVWAETDDFSHSS